MPTFTKLITIGDGTVAVACDGQCHKAWGTFDRPRSPLSSRRNDWEYFADHELGTAPAIAGKPHDGDQLNAWCRGECERCVTAFPGEPAIGDDFSQRVRNLGRRWPITTIGPAPTPGKESPGRP